MPDQVPENTKEERLAAMMTLMMAKTRAFNASCVGRVLNVLLTGPGRHPGQLVGRSPYLQPVNVFADASRIGSVLPVTITRTDSNSLHAEPHNAADGAEMP